MLRIFNIKLGNWIVHSMIGNLRKVFEQRNDIVKVYF